MELNHVLAILLPLLLTMVMQTSAIFCTDGNTCPCNDNYNPVCARNGCSYLNQCRLMCSGAKFLKKGECLGE